jgi:hypothetical protein
MVLLVPLSWVRLGESLMENRVLWWPFCSTVRQNLREKLRNYKVQGLVVI